MSIALFFVLAIVAAAAILQPLLPGSRATYPLPGAREPRTLARRSPPDAAGNGRACPKCGAPVKAADRFCVRCGGALDAVPVSLSCASCGAVLAEDDRFCRRCGAAVGAREARP